MSKVKIISIGLILFITFKATELLSQTAPLKYEITYSPHVEYNSILSKGKTFVWKSTDIDNSLSEEVSLKDIFNFHYQGELVKGFKISTNGWITFNTSLTSSEPQNNLGSPKINSVIAPFWDDISANSKVTFGQYFDASMRYMIEPYDHDSKVLTIEWGGMERTADGSTNLNFQLKLYEKSNGIQFLYGEMNGYTGGSNYIYSYSCGMNGSKISDVPKDGEVLALRHDNTSDFVSSDASVANKGCNSLYYLPNCYSTITFKPGEPNKPYIYTAILPGNDDQESAFHVPVVAAEPNGHCGQVYSSEGATPSHDLKTCKGIPDDDVWFKFTSYKSTIVTVKVYGAGGYDPVIEILDDGWSTLKEPACVNETGEGMTETWHSDKIVLKQGYYIRVYDARKGSGKTGVFSIAVFTTP